MFLKRNFDWNARTSSSLDKVVVNFYDSSAGSHRTVEVCQEAYGHSA